MLPFGGTIDEYDLVKLLGSGTGGRVYLAIDTVLAREVAIKILSAQPGLETRRRFLVEARAAARLQHTNVVSTYRAGDVADHPYLVTELVRGDSLAECTLPLPWRRCLEIGIGLARGLAAAHRSGVLHRDIKPGNVVIAGDGTPKLLDFGLALLLEHPGSARPVAMTGTPDYIAPELWRGEPATPRSDVYSLGAVLYQLLTGRAPFAHVPDGELGEAVRTQDPPALADLVTELQPGLGQLVQRCLARDSAQRPASADELRASLEELANVASGLAPPPGNPYRGLLPFEAEHRGVFFGRSTELGTAIDRLRHETLLVMAGDSGVGKSSLCRAGLVPAIEEGALGDGRQWTTVVFLPGLQPVRAMAAALARILARSEDELATAAVDDPTLLAHELSRALGSERGLLVFVDQLEELCTLARPEEAERFDALLAAVVDRSRGVRVVATLRADFLGRITGRLAEHLDHALFLLRPLGAERLREIVVGPARASGISFESDVLVEELVHTGSKSGTELPLLQFALAEMWDARDRDRGVITTASFHAMGGVSGALARHADAVIGGLPPGDRRAARDILVSLVTADGTRARRESGALTAGRAGGRAALEALVRARLVATREDDRGTSIELAHEALVRGWPVLAGWLREDAGLEAARERLRIAAAEWERLGHSSDGLWGPRQVADVASVALDSLEAAPRRFLEASRRGARRRRLRRVLAAAVAVSAIAIIYVVVDARHRSALSARVDERLGIARSALATANQMTMQATAARDAAIARFEARDRNAGELAWRQVSRIHTRASAALAEAAQAVEVALAEDPAREDVRALLGDVLLARSLDAERMHRDSEQTELAERLVLYDADGSRRRMLARPARVQLDSDPANAAITITRHVADAAGTFGQTVVATGVTPFLAELPAGSYLATVSAAGRVAISHPFVAERGTAITARLRLPTTVPASLVHVTGGAFLFGSSADEESRLGFYDTVPLHRTTTRDFLVARHEVTFGDWLAFLDALPPLERARRLPAVAQRVAGGGLLRLSRDGARWQLHLRPAEQVLAAAAGERVRYEGRTLHSEQDWLRFPVTGISADDAVAYTRWLATTNRIPHARLCTEHEWERAARGADGREYPHGRSLPALHANFDETYAKGPKAMGPDEVGSHPASQSPYGLFDASGNAFEWTTGTLGDGDFVVRGGSYYHDRKTARLSNRSVSVSTLRDATVGMRVCADVP